MALSSATVRKVDGHGLARVTLEVRRSGGFHVRCQLLEAMKVVDPEGTPFASEEVEAGCRSGAHRARTLLALVDEKVVIRAIHGRIARPDLEVFALATMLAIGHALGRETLIPKLSCERAFGSWHALWSCRGSYFEASDMSASSRAC